MSNGIGSIGPAVRLPREVPDPFAGAGAADPLAPSKAAAPGGFAATLGNFVGEVGARERASDAALAQFVRGEAQVHDVAIAAKEAEIATRLLVEVRDRLVGAYKEIMQMPM